MFAVRIERTLAALMASMALAACGGGGGGGGNNGGTNPRPNIAPTTQSSSVTVAEDEVLTGTLQAQDADADPLTFSISSSATKGTLSVSGATYTYRPNLNFFGTDQFSYTASDGRASSDIATVTIQVTSVNDPPTIPVFSAPSDSPAGRRIDISVPATDVDGTVTLTATQTVGPAVGQLQTSADRVMFDTPSVSQVLSITMQLRATDDQGAFATTSFSMTILPTSGSGNLRTILGSPTGPGIHWVITGDGFRADELPLFRTNAIVSANFVLNTPEIAPYKPAWNVHLLDAVSNESGLDVPSEGIVRDTVFNATTNCQSVERVVCVDSPRVSNAVITELPAYDFILVLVNTSRYGGSGGRIAVATTHVQSHLITFHEFGHSFARLADEYVDAVAAPTFLPFYREDTYANVTRLSSPAQTKWRHWFADPANVPRAPGAPGVGLFEGAYYQPTGFFRPKSDSFMRTLSRNMGEVNVEAWGLSVYRVGGAVTSSLPAASTVTATPGNAPTFSVARLLEPASQSIEWYVDGTERTDARDTATFACCSELTGQHSVRVRVSDVTGRIRAPDPGPSRFERTWTLTIQ